MERTMDIRQNNIESKDKRVKYIIRTGLRTTWFLVMGLTLITARVFAGDAGSLTLESVLGGLEQRYQAPSYRANFHQASPLPDIQITERAEGKAFFKRPGKFRWSYESPEVLDYISDGETLWIHSPVDNTVWIGRADDFFGKGGSAAVLTDIRQIRSRFAVTLAETADPETVGLHLIPNDPSAGIAGIDLIIHRSTFDLLTIVSVNVNNEETRITFSDLTFDTPTDDGLFSFTVPEKAVIIPLD
jgi:outer membrane lipoprotein carrier protein